MVIDITIIDSQKDAIIGILMLVGVIVGYFLATGWDSPKPLVKTTSAKFWRLWTGERNCERLPQRRYRRPAL